MITRQRLSKEVTTGFAPEKGAIARGNAPPSRPSPPLLLLLLLSSCIAVAGSCQALDPNLASGRLSGAGDTGGPGTEATGGTSGTVATEACATRRMQAYEILSTNCAICHQAPGNPALYLGSFNFILDLTALTSMASPQSSTTLTLKYIVGGRPEDSYIYQRILDESMPPMTRTQRPSSDDIDILSQWLTSCIDDPSSPAGWAGPPQPGDGGVISGPTLVPCSPTTLCPPGGCCVFNQCRPNGSTCGAVPNPIPGQADLPGLAGMCMNGSCLNDAGRSCGKVGEPCCELRSCTASRSSCLITDFSMCSACGDVGQPCCNPNNCVDGRACVGFGVGRVGTCQMCGALGQPCCGTGAAALQTCNANLTCMTILGTGNMCTPAGGSVASTGGATGAAGRGGRGGAATGGQGGGR